MNDLLERYLHQVGRYLPPKERAEIEAELRSLLQDQLDDRYGGAASPAEVASVLSEFGDPQHIAASYNSEQYLVGPDIYPYMMVVLKNVWLIIPTIVIFLNIFSAVISSEAINWLDFFLETLIGVGQATLIFSALAVLIFAFFQHADLPFDEKKAPFKPLDLPKVDDPRLVDRYEAIFGSIFGTFAILVMLYFLRVGGLTLEFNLTNPSDVIPVSALWLSLLIGASVGMISLNLFALRRNRWGIWTWFSETLLELVGMICLYFVLYLPLYERLVIANPALENLPFGANVPEIIVILSAILTLTTRGATLVKLWNYRSITAPFAQ